MKPHKPGIINLKGTKPTPSELVTALFLSEHGYNVSFIKVSTVPGVKTPDIVLSDGLAWEIKTIVSVREQTIKHTFAHAIKQSPNIIFDLRTLSPDQARKAHLLIRKIFPYFRRAKRLKIITKNGQLENLRK